MASLSEHNLRASPVGGRLTQTLWDQVSLAQNGDSVAREALCLRYWYPLYAYLRRKGCTAADAQDLVQGFFTKLLQTEALGKPDPAKCKFRTFLLNRLDYYARDQWKRGEAGKRGGKATVFSLDEIAAEENYALEPKTMTDPARLFERRWALAVFDAALAKLRSKCAKSGRANFFDALAPTLRGEPLEENYVQIGARFGMTEGAIKVAVNRLRGEFRKYLREEVAATLTDAGAVDEELEHLYRALTT